MKKEIMAYVTALSDVYSETINQPMIKALNDILNFVEDIPTNKEPELITENIKIRGTNKLLEALCDSLIEKNCELVNEKQIIKNEKSKVISELIQANKKLRRRSRVK